jgi:hypothetical protein
MPDSVIASSIKEIERVLKPKGLLLLTFDYHPTPSDKKIGFTANDFTQKVLNQSHMKILNNPPDFSIKNWDAYILEVNRFFETGNPNTSYGVVMQKQ